MQTLSPDLGCAGRPEADLVVQCARTLIVSENWTYLEAALAQSLEWNVVDRLADYHCMTPIVAYILNEYGSQCVPREVCERLKQRSLLVAVRNLALMQEWQRVTLLLETAGIPVISVKGPALALLAYQNVAMREFLDLDLLIRPSDISRVRDTLVSSGYQLQSPRGSRDNDLLRSPNRQLVFVNDESGTVVEIHWEALPAMLPFQMPVALLFDSARWECQGGISFLSLSREHLLLFLCAHGTKHCWMRLQWLCDLACYVQRFQGLDWELCIRQVEAMNCGLVVTHSLLLAEQVLGLSLPPLIERRVLDVKSKRTAAIASRFFFQSVDKVGNYETLRYYLVFTTGWRNHLDIIFQRILVPDAPDWKAVRLPRLLSFLYYVVRPLRFILNRLSSRTRRASDATKALYIVQERFGNSHRR